MIIENAINNLENRGFDVKWFENKEKARDYLARQAFRNHDRHGRFGDFKTDGLV